MNKQLQHITKWVKSKGIKIIMTDENTSHFPLEQPDTILISRHTRHGIAASILHEYYHSQQYRHQVALGTLCNDTEFRAKIEYRAETFVIRCFRKLGLAYDKTFVEQGWRDMPDYLLNEEYCYTIAYKLLIKNKVIT